MGQNSNPVSNGTDTSSQLYSDNGLESNISRMLQSQGSQRGLLFMAIDKLPLQIERQRSELELARQAAESMLTLTQFNGSAPDIPRTRHFGQAASTQGVSYGSEMARTPCHQQQNMAERQSEG